MLRGSTALICLLLLASGCGSGPADSDGSGTTTRSESSPAQAQQLLTEAVAAVASEDLTGFQAETRLDFYPIATTEGMARAGAWTATTTFTEPGTEDAVMRARSVDDTVWMQMADGRSDLASCWFQMSPTQVPLGIPALTPGEPAYITALGALTATGFGKDPTGHSLVASIDLAAALHLLPGKLLQAIDVDAAAVGDADSDIVVGVSDGTVHDLRLSGSALREAFTRAGVTLSAHMEAALDAVSVLVEYSTAPPSPAIEPPAESLVVEPGDQGCTG